MKPGTLLCVKDAFEPSVDSDRIFALIVRRHSRFLVEVLWCSREIQKMCTSELYRYKVIA
jgi:hypothetical protein